MLFSDIWNCTRHWPFLNPPIFPLESYSFFSLFSIVPTEWFIVPYSRFSMATNQIQPGLETSMKFQGVGLKVTTGELLCRCLLQGHDSVPIKDRVTVHWGNLGFMHLIPNAVKFPKCIGESHLLKCLIYSRLIPPVCQLHRINFKEVFLSLLSRDSLLSGSASIIEECRWRVGSSNTDPPIF